MKYTTEGFVYVKGVYPTLISEERLLTEIERLKEVFYHRYPRYYVHDIETRKVDYWYEADRNWREILMFLPPRVRRMDALEIMIKGGTYSRNLPYLFTTS